MSPGEYRLRIVYRKSGRLRHLSHLEVIHSLERTVRRARLPVAVTHGFSPHMKVAFGPALPVGTAGEREYLDIWLTSLVSAEDALASLVTSAPGDLAPFEAGFVRGNAPSLTAALTIAVYHVEIDGEEISQDGMQAALARVLSVGELAVESKGKHKVFDLARAVPKDVRVTGRHGGVDVDLTVRMGPQGSLRPESLIRSALSSANTPVAALRTTRLDTFVEDDEGVWSRPV